MMNYRAGCEEDGEMKGTLYWITGLSGAGKTTIGNMLYRHLKKQKSNVVILDGDMVRSAFGNDLGYSQEDRLKCAMRYSGLSRLLTEQGIDVICCTISMFDEVRDWNRNQIENYLEIFLDVPMEILQRRNQKNLYQDVKIGKASNVVGMDLQLQLPQNPDIRIVNDGESTPEDVFAFLLAQIHAQE